MKNINNLEKIFKQLNSNCNYLILRNYEGFFKDILLEKHNDIDVLCYSKKDRKLLVNLFDAEKRINIDNGIHYKFLYKSKEISLDIRTVGDGYYDSKWCRRMLKNRIYNPKGFYTMNSEDYYYSLIYHAIYQKEYFSNDYLIRLREMKNKITYNKKDFENELYSFMKNNNFFYTIPYDKYVITYFDNDLLGKRIKRPFIVSIKLYRDKVKESYFYGKYNGFKHRLIRKVK